MDVSIVFSTHNRAHLLARSLECYARQSFGGAFEIIAIDDDSTDDTQALLYGWSQHLDIKAIRVRKPVGTGWRDGDATRKLGIRAAKGDLIICTHPEVMPGRASVAQMWQHRADKVYLACKVYYLSIDDQSALDTVPWQEQGALAVRQLPNFYSQPSAELRKHDDYTHEATDRHTIWESWVFAGFTRATWRWLGGWREFNTWGSGDVDMLTRRRLLGIPNATMLDPESITVHQNHDVAVTVTDVPTPRDMAACMASLPRYSRPEEALLDYL